MLLVLIDFVMDDIWLFEECKVFFFCVEELVEFLLKVLKVLYIIFVSVIME